MEIVIVCDVLGKENNGTTIAAMNLIRSLKEKGHGIRILCCDSELTMQQERYQYYTVPCRNFYMFNHYVESNGVALARPVASVIEAALEGADHVHVMMPFALGHQAAKMAKEKGIPVTAGFHVQAENFSNHIFLMHAELVNHLTYRYFYHNLYRYCDAIHYPTKFIREIFEAVVGPTNGYVISNGVNRQFYEPAKQQTGFPEWEGKFVILFTGRYSKEKSHKILIEACARSKHADDIQLVCAGEGPCREKLERLALKRLHNQPTFAFYSREELLAVIDRADLYVHAAEVEIEAISCLEAIARGKVPVIANSARCATKAFALTQQNLFTCNNPISLAEKIDYWIEHPKEKEKCSRDYRGFSQQFEQQQCMADMEQMIYDVRCYGEDELLSERTDG